MKYTNLSKLPKKVQEILPKAAQKIYLETFNLTWQEYKKINERDHTNLTPYEYARKAAWAAVKAKYQKDKDSGRWELILKK